VTPWSSALHAAPGRTARAITQRDQLAAATQRAPFQAGPGQVSYRPPRCGRRSVTGRNPGPVSYFRVCTITTIPYRVTRRRVGRPAEHNNLISAPVGSPTAPHRPPQPDPGPKPADDAATSPKVVAPGSGAEKRKRALTAGVYLWLSRCRSCDFVRANVCTGPVSLGQAFQVSALTQVSRIPITQRELTEPLRTFLCETA
jgi:hypothetical protein